MLCIKYKGGCDELNNNLFHFIKRKTKFLVRTCIVVFALLFISQSNIPQAKALTYIKNNNVVILASNSTTNNEAGTLIDDFEKATPWYVSGGTAAVDVNNHKYGSSGLKLTASNYGGEVSISRSISLNCADMNTLSFWLYVPDKSKLAVGSIDVLLSSNEFNSFFMSTKTTYDLNNGWNYLKLDKSDFTSVNSADWKTPMTTILINVFSKIGEKVNITLDEMRKNEKTEPKVVVMMDDGYASVYDKMYSYYKSKNIPVTIGVVKNLVGADNYMAESQLKELYTSGWDMANHTTTHSVLTGLSDSEITNEITSCTKYLNSLGFTRSSNCFIYPSGAGADDLHIRSVVKNSGIIKARGANAGVQYTPLDEPLSLKNTLELKNSTTLDDVKAAIDKAITTGGTAIILGHRVSDTPTDTYEVRTDIVKGMADYITEKNIKAVTFSNIE